MGLQCIFFKGLYLLDHMNIFRNGYSGGTGGTEFIDVVPPNAKRIAAIQLRVGAYLDAIQTVYELVDGKMAPQPMRSGDDSGNPAEFVLEGDEYLTGICGRYGNSVDSIVFQTNNRKSPVFWGACQGEL